ncbi:uncharacterized protein LOC127714590 [Mytilus californianus]|uniref:uncharacterized protein LOC127714590 n=1 Tax=Mytilus californianus TaxID=6549 RepID=UPI002247E7AC|nr:uncharacterized protein LOC127714590 [Mytilus californianus]XP_052076625.1 uncharacterized protein LOC127714590 [Mytilus californianus]
MRLCVSITILMVLEMFFIAKSKACSKCSCLVKNFVFTASYTKTALISSEYTENTTGLMKCAWVIKAQNSSHSVTFKMSQVLASKSSFCGEDYVFIRDGSSGRGPPLGYWCKDGTYDTEVTSYSNAIYVELETYSNGVAGLIFVMSFWESSVSSSVQYGPIEYGIANYVLLAFSVLIGSLLLGAVVFLIYREYKKHQAEKEMKFREKLLMRRTGISGRSGGIINDDFRHDSVSDKNTSFIFLSPTPTSEISL